MKNTGRSTLIAAIAIMMAACGENRGPDGAAGTGTAADTGAEATSQAGGPTDAPGGALAVREERQAELRAGQPADVVLVSARGASYTDADVHLLIRDARGDTLWFDTWSTTHYFRYDVAGERSPEASAEYVRAQLDSLLHDSRFAQRGMPARIQQQDRDALRESISYHLAEIDWRNRASLTASDPTPADAHDRISAATVAPERVDAVLAELLAGPTYWYYAGGEVTYVIGWSPREYSFVRLFSCC